MRLFARGGWLSYRALFNWRHPSLYIPVMFGKPLLQILFFTYLGRFSQVGDDRWFVVGNALQATVIAGVFGMVMTLSNEREFGTLPAVLATPANRAALFLGRALPAIGNGLVVVTFGLLAGVAVLGVRVPPAAVPALAAAVLVTVVSCTMFGLAFGAVAMRARDVLVGANLAYTLTMLLCGVNVPLSVLPGWLATLGRLLPLTHGIQAARELAAGAGLADVAPLLAREALVGLAYALSGYALLRIFEVESRRRATLDTR